MSRTYTVLIQRSDSFEGEFGIPSPAGAAPFPSSPSSQLPPGPKRQPRQWPACPPGSLPLPACQLGSPSLPRRASWPPSASPCASRAEEPRAAAGGARGQKKMSGSYSLVASQRMYWIWKLWDHEVQRLCMREIHPVTRTCMTVPDCLKILGGDSAFA